MKTPTRFDMWVLLLSTVRYSLGRMTYMTEYAGDLVKRYREYLTTDQVEQIGREVADQLRLVEGAGKTLGSECDHVSWSKFAQWCEDGGKK